MSKGKNKSSGRADPASSTHINKAYRASDKCYFTKRSHQAKKSLVVIWQTDWE
jgi:hypothetical protein